MVTVTVTIYVVLSLCLRLALWRDVMDQSQARKAADEREIAGEKEAEDASSVHTNRRGVVGPRKSSFRFFTRGQASTTRMSGRLAFKKKNYPRESTARCDLQPTLASSNPRPAKLAVHPVLL